MFVSPLDANFIALKRAAMLIAREQFGFAPDDIMEMFKHALFMHEFERDEITVPGHENSDALNLPLLRIEAPPTQQTARGLSPERQPQELFPVYAQTVAEVLSERDALPGTAETWPMFNESPYSAVAMDNALHDLARIPYGAFPPKGQDILGAILLSRAKLAVWMQAKKYTIPSFLEDIEPRRPEPVKPVPQADGSEQSDRAERGRPRKPGWRRVVELVRELHATIPQMKHYTLALEARKKAASEFDEKDLPSVETIVRHLKSILASKG